MQKHEFDRYKADIMNIVSGENVHDIVSSFAGIQQLIEIGVSDTPYYSNLIEEEKITIERIVKRLISLKMKSKTREFAGVYEYSGD